jgi:hypothetical protein
MVEKQEEKKDRFIVGEVPTQYGIAIIDTLDNKVYSTETALAKLLTDVQELKKLLN